jgi:hypothetical protein
VQEAAQFEFDRHAERIMALPGGGPRFEYCEMRFVPIRESGSIFDRSGYFSARRLGANRQPVRSKNFNQLVHNGLRGGANLIAGMIPGSLWRMDWKRWLASIAGSVDQELLTRNESLRPKTTSEKCPGKYVNCKRGSPRIRGAGGGSCAANS